MSSSSTPSPRPDEHAGWLTWRRATAIKGIAAAVVTFPLATYALYTWWPTDYRHLDELGRIALALRCLPVVGVFCFFMFTQTARLFDTKGAERVLAGEESERWQKNQKIFTNTVEQAAIFVPMLLALSTVVAAEHAHILPVLAVLWLFGRVAFFVAYHIDPAYRAFGFDYTLFPALTAGGWFAVELLAG